MILLLACVAPETTTIKRSLPETGGTDSFYGEDSETQKDSEEDSHGDSHGDSQNTDDTANPQIEACYLGTARDHRTCFPVIPYDPAWGSDYDYPAPYQGSPQYAEPVRYLDIDSLDPNAALAPNFVVSELLQSWKGRYGIVQSHFIDRLQDIRDEIGEALIVTSGYRNPVYNASVGGADYSRHTYGDAADLDTASYSVEALGDICNQHGAGYVGLYEDGHTHCDWRDDALDTAFYDAPNGPPPPAPTAHLRQSAQGFEAPAEGFDEGEPFRRWWAYNAQGQLITTATGRQFQPPPQSTDILVRIGGQIELHQHLQTAIP